MHLIFSCSRTSKKRDELWPKLLNIIGHRKYCHFLTVPLIVQLSVLLGGDAIVKLSPIESLSCLKLGVLYIHEIYIMHTRAIQKPSM